MDLRFSQLMKSDKDIYLGKQLMLYFREDKAIDAEIEVLEVIRGRRSFDGQKITTSTVLRKANVSFLGRSCHVVETKNSFYIDIYQSVC